MAEQEMPGTRSQPAVITPYADGPLIVRGDFLITDQAGQVIDPGRKTIALCRCGRSALKPFCDGSHRRGFRATGGDERTPLGRRAADLADTAEGQDEQAPERV